jgi:hypothetical protein
MIQNLDPSTIFNFIVKDFEDAWDALAGVASAQNRGNFMFARQAMVLLEWAARLAASDKNGIALSDFSAKLYDIEPRYFTELPGGPAPQKNKMEFKLPSMPSPNPARQLIRALFDLIRHGQAHQYQQIPVELSDGKVFWIRLSGPTYRFQLSTAESRRTVHLGYTEDQSGNIWLLVRPDLFFLDLKSAVERSNLLGRELSFVYLRRGGTNGSAYQFDSSSLKSALETKGHPVISI